MRLRKSIFFKLWHFETNVIWCFFKWILILHDQKNYFLLLKTWVPEAKTRIRFIDRMSVSTCYDIIGKIRLRIFYILGWTIDNAENPQRTCWPTKLIRLRTNPGGSRSLGGRRQSKLLRCRKSAWKRIRD